MLKSLHIQNLILIESATISFQLGLNTLTGETGSGKSAIMHALGLAIGERADMTLLRRGCEKGSIEAVFEIKHPGITALLVDGGIEHEPEQDLIIRRELSLSGKGRIFINQQQVQLSFLRRLGQQLVLLVGQHSYQSLLSLDTHREVLDLYGSLKEHLQRYQQAYDEEHQLKQKLEHLKQQEAQRLREMDICQHELEELENAHLKEGEDEELFAEYSVLFHAEELLTKTQEINQALSGERQSLIAALNRQKQTLEGLVKKDASLQDTALAFQNAMIELQEISYTLRHYQQNLFHDPNRLHQVNERLTQLNRLKRKYGAKIEDILAYQVQTKQKLNQLEHADEEIAQLEEQLKQRTHYTLQYAEELSQERRRWALRLEKALTAQLHSLNMPQASLYIEVREQKLTWEGKDHIEFFLAPNRGENPISLKEGASGGEVSRVLLALQTLLAGKEERGTLIFDEIDANIGGETAALIGNKLHEMGQQHQVICITHFPQVASQADHHLQILKEEKEGRTFTLVRELTASTRQQELHRMTGSLSFQA